MNDFTFSFFDSCSEKSNIWIKLNIDPLNDVTESILKNYELKSNFYIMSKKNKIKPCMLILTKQDIYYFKVLNNLNSNSNNSNKRDEIIPGKKIPLEFLRMKIINNTKVVASFHRIQQSPILFNYSFQFLKNMQKKEFFTSDAKVYKEWRKKLQKLVIMHSFHEDFQVLKLIGKGSFAKVYLANKLETNEKFAVKAFNKEYLSNHSIKGKVQ
jgi:hypothetical protein